MTATSHDDQRPCFESLEPRLLLDGSVLASVVEGELRITGDAADNAVVLTGLPDGGYRITGLTHAGGPTTINGATFVEVGNVPLLRVLVDLGSGDDVMNVGSILGLDTTVENILDISLGSGTNNLNIGRIEHSGLLGFGGQVTVNAMVTVDNQTFGVGNVLITGAHMSSFNAHLGYGSGERSVVIADLYYGLTYHPPSDIIDVRTIMSNLTIANPAGQLDAVIHDTSATLVDISTAEGNDSFDIRGVHFNETVIKTYDGRDNLQFGPSEYRDNRIYGLTLQAGRDTDTIVMSDTEVTSHTIIDMQQEGFGGGQTLSISRSGGCELTDLTIRGRGVSIGFNDVVGVNETLVHGDLDIETGFGDVDDDLTMRNVTVTGATSVVLRGGDDYVLIQECHFYDDATFDLSQGKDTFLIGQLLDRYIEGGNTRFSENAFIDTGDGSDQVAITNAEVDGLLFVQLGPSARRGQRAQIAAMGGTVQAGDLGVAGTGRTNIFIGNTATTGPSVIVDDILSISTGMDRSRDTVVIQNAHIGGETGISTGGGNDLVVMQRSQFTGPITTHLGDGVDFLSIWDCDFLADAEFYGDGMRDLMWVLDSTFAGRAVFSGGHGQDVINRSLRSRNTFDLIGQPQVDIEREF